MSLRSLALTGLFILSLSGCARKYNPYGQQVQRAAGLAAQGKKALLSRCLDRLREVNSQGHLGHSLERFQKHPRLSAAGDK